MRKDIREARIYTSGVKSILIVLLFFAVFWSAMWGVCKLAEIFPDIMEYICFNSTGHHYSEIKELIRKN